MGRVITDANGEVTGVTGGYRGEGWLQVVMSGYRWFHVVTGGYEALWGVTGSCAWLPVAMYVYGWLRMVMCCCYGWS